MTSRFHDNQFSGSKQSILKGGMASLPISSLFSFFAGEQKSIDRGENHFQSSHIESCVYLPGVLGGEVHANMKKKHLQSSGMSSLRR